MNRTLVQEAQNLRICGQDITSREANIRDSIPQNGLPKPRHRPFAASATARDVLLVRTVHANRCASVIYVVRNEMNVSPVGQFAVFAQEFENTGLKIASGAFHYSPRIRLTQKPAGQRSCACSRISRIGSPFGNRLSDRYLMTFRSTSSQPRPFMVAPSISLKKCPPGG